MTGWIEHLIAFSAALAARQPHRFGRLVKNAYEAGASREELLSTVDSAKEQAAIPAPVLARAYATIHTWYWMESRRRWHQRELAPQVA